MPTNKSRSGDAKETTTRFRAEPMHLVAQGLVKPEDPDGEPRVLFRIPLGPDERICVLGKTFPSMEEWTLRRARRRSDGRWVWDRSAGLQLDPNAVVRLRDGLIHGLHQMGSVAPSVSMAYLAERYEHGAESGDANALVSHLVLRALALALGNGDGEALAAMGREALRQDPGPSARVRAGRRRRGALDLKGDEARRVGRNRRLVRASRFCDELSKDTDFAEAADELSWDIERLHPEAVRQAEIREAKAPDFPNTGSGRGRIAEKLAESSVAGPTRSGVGGPYRPPHVRRR
ncbi:MAG: hypothetical protein IPF99_28675 [Deltaproteobacteria bacterium]|nr:hypothetical protein [Deltaproteobacteria bacterium]